VWGEPPGTAAEVDVTGTADSQAAVGAETPGPQPAEVPVPGPGEAAEPAPVHAPAPDRKALVELLGPVRSRLALALLMQAVASVAGLVPFACVAEIARELLAGGPADTGRVWAVVWVAVGALGARILLAGGALAVTHFADNDLQLHVRRRMARHLGAVPLGWFTDRNSGQVKKAVQDDVTTMHHLVAHASVELTAALVTPLAALAYLFWVDWRLALVTLVPVPLFLLTYGAMMRGMGEQISQWDTRMGRVSAAAVEFIKGIQVVKAFGQARRAHRRLLAEIDDYADFFSAWVRPMLKAAAIGQFIIAPPTMLLVILAGGVWFVASGWVEPVDVLPFALLGVGLTAPYATLEYGSLQLKTAATAAERGTSLLATPRLAEPAAPRRPDGHRVDLDRVGFSYDGRTRVLRGVSATLEPGTVTALVGPSGSGKSTLAKLLPRFWDVTEGAIRIGGVDVRDIGSDELYRHVGFVFQDVHLLRTGVRDNIRLGRPDATDAAVEQAARAAQGHQRITELPRGYDSVVHQGTALSGGEAQRISIARALLADAPILVLDEATAFADPESEALIQDALSELVAGRTLLVIAHRLGTITHADQILVLGDGEVVERGRHPDLLRNRGLYARMWAAHERDRDWTRTAGGATTPAAASPVARSRSTA
jgi:ATP-binding cassette subfamily B protein IrtA